MPIPVHFKAKNNDNSYFYKNSGLSFPWVPYYLKCVTNELYIGEWRGVVGVKALVIFVSRSDSYCKSGNFRENFIFANGVKRHICNV